MVNLALVPAAVILALEAEFNVQISWPLDSLRCPDEQVGVYDGTTHLGDLCATGAIGSLGARFTEPELRAGVERLAPARSSLGERVARRDMETAPTADVDVSAFSRRLWREVDGNG